jgi:MazG family protein
MTDDATTLALRRLQEVIVALRTPDTGCPWDLQQTETTMAPRLLEEAYEAVDAILAGDADGACAELGDVLMNVFLIARIADQSQRFDLSRVAQTVADKLVRRHPHVFGTAARADAATVLATWERIKREERTQEAEPDRGTLLAGLPRALPALLQAQRIGEKVARVGFDWPDAEGARGKVDEEIGELDRARRAADHAAVEGEVGDVLFSVANLARHLGVDPEMALRRTCAKFVARFAAVERALGDRLADAPLEEKEALWQAAKAGEGG